MVALLLDLIRLSFQLYESKVVQDNSRPLLMNLEQGPGASSTLAVV